MERIKEYFEQCNLMLDLMKTRVHLSSADLTHEINKNLNDELYKELDDYEESYGHIDAFKGIVESDVSSLLSAVYYDLRKLVPLVFMSDKRIFPILNQTELLLNELNDNVSSYDDMLIVYRNYKLAILEPILDLKVSMDLNHHQNKAILFGGLSNLDYLYQYGLPVCDTDLELASFISSYDDKSLEKIAETIVKAFLHGFVSQSRDRRNRSCIKMTYVMGQELIAKKVVEKFQDMNIYPNLFMVSGHQKYLQYDYDHQYDLGLILDETYMSYYKETVETVYLKHEKMLRNVCGYIGIGSFGHISEPPVVNPNAVVLNNSQKILFKHLHMHYKITEDQYIKPSDISFCKITFPNPSIKGNFNEIFDDFVSINTMTSDIYEKYQQIIIDELDKGKFVHCKGGRGNQTDIVVALGPLKDSLNQTNFMNCGGDLNIPHGEVFTTPLLKGTHGILHFKQIFLKGYHYTDLKLKFKDGIVVDYTCNNFKTDEENRQYINNTLLNGNERVPMGEFAIGTNTLAYAIVKKHGIIEELPILLVEKMGPHFAIGDPCYAFGEDEKVFNLLDGKEIIAKENEITKTRNFNVSDAYVGMHTDMTIPYEDIYELRIVDDACDITLIKDGLFTLSTLEVLNEPLKEVTINYNVFTDVYRSYLSQLYHQKNKLKRKDYFNQSIKTLQKDNEELYSIFLDNYEESLLNPTYVFKNYGEQGVLLSAILYDCKEMILMLYRKRELLFNLYVSFLHKVIDLLDEGCIHLIHQTYEEFKMKLLDESRYGEYSSFFYDDIFGRALTDESYLFRYGFYVKKEDFETSRAFRNLEISLLESSGSVVANAFHKSFEVAKKNRGIRNIVKLEYHLGQEPLMAYVASHLRLLGYTIKITQVFASTLNKSAEIDHSDDQVLCLTHDYVIKKKQKLKDLLGDSSKILKSICGFVRLLQFGRIEESPRLSSYKLSLSETVREELKDLMWYERSLANGYMPKSELSYTGVAYPSYNIGDNFMDILKETMMINNMDARIHESIQDTIIESLNGASYVKIKGRGQNKTDIKVKIKEEFDPKTQSIFKNTGADVNIPVGEVFTTPVLKGTTGILHVSEVYRESYRYEELVLKFEDGMIKNYMCSNFESEKDNVTYIEDTLLFPHKTLPMGEFAIGTNTYAYKVSKKFNIIDKLPGLIVEKMGPHFAIGDTCYAYGEDLCVINHTTGKEVVAKDNEITLERHSGKNVYYHSHTDITIPYEDLKHVTAVYESGIEVKIIEEGRFVLEGTEALNEHLI